MVGLLGGDVIPQRQAQRAVGHFMGKPQGQQHMAGIQRAGGTGAARGSGNAPGIKKQQQGFALDPFKTEVDGAGYPVFPVAV